MATRQLLAELASAYTAQSGCALHFESVGGVDAARRVQAGEAFDLVVLASDAIERLCQTGQALPDSRVDLVRSAVAVAVRAGAPLPQLGDEAALRETVAGARSIGFSTGPSGVHLLALFERWGLAQALRDRIVQAPAGVPVAALVARGEAELGFQQLSELMNQPGVVVAGLLPDEVQFITTFSAAICKTCTQVEAVRHLFRFMTSPAAALLQHRHGLQPA